jgi:hypothetical protein
VRRRRTQTVPQPSVQRVIDSMSTPAFVRNGRLDVLAINALGRALYAPAFADSGRPANLARFCFLDPASQTFYPDWEQVAHATVAVLRSEAGRDPYSRELTDLVGELATRSDFFRTGWAAHNVTLHQHGTKHFQHPVVGLIDVTFDSMEPGFVPFSPLGKGFLTGTVDTSTSFAANDLRAQIPRFAGDALKHNLTLVDEVKTIAAGRGATPGQVALAWLLAQQPGIVPIPGTTKPHRLAENLAAADLTLAEAELARLSGLSAQIEIEGGRYPDFLEDQTNL